MRITEKELALATDNAAFRQRIGELEYKLIVAKEALAYYADDGNWGDMPKTEHDSGADVLQIDQGGGYERARQALTQLEESR